MNTSSTYERRPNTTAPRLLVSGSAKEEETSVQPLPLKMDCQAMTPTASEAITPRGHSRNWIQKRGLKEPGRVRQTERAAQKRRNERETKPRLNKILMQNMPPNPDSKITWRFVFLFLTYFTLYDRL